LQDEQSDDKAQGRALSCSFVHDAPPGI
jgi:hypothetical protein